MDKYNQAIADSQVITDDAQVAAKVNEILEKHLEENRTPEVLRQLFNCIDLTTLKSTDSQQSVANFTERVNAFEQEHPELPNVAAICVYPNFVPIVRTVLDVSSVDIAAVAGCFPSAQSFIEVKMAEIALAVEAGADEIDIVFPLGDYLDNDYEEVADQLSEMKHACRESLLKVILETGALKNARDIRNASVLSLYSGADFLKTSTGKEYPGASLEAAYVMCQSRSTMPRHSSRWDSRWPAECRRPTTRSSITPSSRRCSARSGAAPTNCSASEPHVWPTTCSPTSSAPRQNSFKPS